MDDIAVHQISAGDGDGADISFDFNGKRIAVSIFPTSPDRRQPFLEDHLVKLLSHAVFADADDDEYEEIVDEVLGVILDAGRNILAEVAPRKNSIPQPTSPDLHLLLYPTMHTFQFKATGGKAVIIPIDPKEAYTCLEANLDYNTESDFDVDHVLPWYSPKEISILETFVQGAGYIVSRVMVNDKEMLCKARGKGLLDSNLEKELASLEKIGNFCLHHHTSIRVPQILGYIKHPEARCIIGFLREWVPGNPLRKIDIPMTLETKRKKWASQIHEMVNQLHDIGVIWGDGKASSVIIDEKDDAWLIDFGGGFTEGWVEEQLMDTVEGDKQALKKIMEFLRIKEGNR